MAQVTLAPLPTNVSFGTVTGRFLTAVADTPEDAGRDPDGNAATDLTIRFSPDLSPAVVRDASASPPTVFALSDVIATVGSTGELLGPDGQAGIRLVASTNSSLEPSGWTWKVVLSSTTFPVTSFSFALDGGATVDIASVVQVPASAGTTLEAWLAAVSAAQAAQAAAAGSASAAAASATQAAAAVDGFRPVRARDLPGTGALPTVGTGSTQTLSAANAASGITSSVRVMPSKDYFRVVGLIEPKWGTAYPDYNG